MVDAWALELRSSASSFIGIARTPARLERFENAVRIRSRTGSAAGSATWFGWNILFPPPLLPAQMEDRKVFNTWMFAQGNEGHDFNAVLTDDERRAIIEYLKTP